MYARNEKYPRVGVFVVFQTRDSKILIEEKKTGFSFPFILFEGGETWEELVIKKKKLLKIPEAHHEWVGSGVAPEGHPYPLVYCVFKVKIETPETLDLGPSWTYLEKDLPLEPISSWIFNQFKSAWVPSLKD